MARSRLIFWLKKQQVSRAVIERLEKTGRLLSWEEPITPDEDPWDTDFTPPANVLNPEQKAGARRNLALACGWEILGGLAARRHRQRQNGSLSARR